MGRSIQTIKQFSPTKNVFEAAQERIARLFDRFQYIVVNFSGGKDSTVLLHLAMEEAQRRHQTIDVILSDEEAIDPDTLVYLETVATWPGIRFHWCCAPITHTLASHHRTLWQCWDATAREIWIRQPPSRAILTHPAWTAGITIGLWSDTLFPDYAREATCHLVGVRCEESYNRHRGIMGSGSYLTARAHMYYAKPIYDWKTTDVWAVIKRQHWPYSAYYDKAQQCKLSRFNTRVAPIGNVASTTRMHLWAMLYPEFWNAVLRRLPELEAMARYGRTQLYRKGQVKPENLTWQEWVFQLLRHLPPEQEQYFRRKIALGLLRWERTHSIPFPETVVAESESKMGGQHSWQKFAKIIDTHDSFNGGTRNLM